MTKKEVKLGKYLTESEKFLGNRGKSETEGMHHCLRGVDASGRGRTVLATPVIFSFSVMTISDSTRMTPLNGPPGHWEKFR